MEVLFWRKKSSIQKISSKVIFSAKIQIAREIEISQFRKSENRILQVNQEIGKGQRRKPYRKCFAFPISQENFSRREKKERLWGLLQTDVAEEAPLSLSTSWCTHRSSAGSRDSSLSFSLSVTEELSSVAFCTYPKDVCNQLRKNLHGFEKWFPQWKTIENFGHFSRDFNVHFHQYFHRKSL